MTAEDLKTALEKALDCQPHIFRNDPRRKELDGNSAGVMANFDCQGTGPEGAFYIGRKIAYPTQQYIDWVVSRFSSRVKRAA